MPDRGPTSFIIGKEGGWIDGNGSLDCSDSLSVCFKPGQKITITVHMISSSDIEDCLIGFSDGAKEVFKAAPDSIKDLFKKETVSTREALIAGDRLASYDVPYEIADFVYQMVCAQTQ